MTGLTALLSHADSAIQRRAALAIADVATAEGLDALCGLLDHGSIVAENAADALCTIGGTDVTLRMRSILGRTSWRAREWSWALGILVRLGDVSALAAAVSNDALEEARGADGVAGHLEYLVTYHSAWFSDEQLTFLEGLKDREWHLPKSRVGMVQFSDPDTFEGHDDYKLSYGRLRKAAAKELKNRNRARTAPHRSTTSE
jgi:hypothetical protein